MSNSRKKVYDSISNTISVIEKTLKEISIEQDISCIINSGLIKREEDTIGFISCFPHGDRAEESLDGLLIISEHTHSIRIKVEVSWSDGRSVSDIGQATIRLTDELHMQDWDNLVANLIDVISKTLTQFLE